jgi:hypothetical protein
MTGSDQYRKAEELTQKAHKYLGQGDGQESAAVWAAVAQIHATLALAAATAFGTTTSEGRAWADVAGTKFLGSVRVDACCAHPVSWVSTQARFSGISDRVVSGSCS